MAVRRIMHSQNGKTQRRQPLPEQSSEPATEVSTYILNTNTKRFHYPSCSSVDEMKDKNKQEYTGTRDELIADGYKPCGRCKP